MTNLMNIALFGLSLLIGLPPVLPGDEVREDNRYCDEALHFCANYPASLLPNKKLLDSENGILLTSDDGFAEVTIATYPQPSGMDTKSLFLQAARKLDPEEKSPKVINSIFGEDFYECYFMIGHHYYYHQSYHFEDHFVRVEIKVPVNMPDRMMIIRGQINLEFNVPERIESTASEETIGG